MSRQASQAERVRVITAPSTTPVSVAEVKERLRLGSNDSFDDTLQALIESATDWAQKYTGTYFITTELEYRLDHFPNYDSSGSLSSGFSGLYKSQTSSNGYASTSRDIVIYATPLQDVTELAYTDPENASTAVSSAEYYLDNVDPVNAARIIPSDGYSWPTDTRSRDAVSVTLNAGYGDDPSDVPAAIRNAIIEIVMYQFLNGAGCSTGGAITTFSVRDAAFASGAKAALNNYKRLRVTNDN